MFEFPFAFEQIAGTTWAYMSALLMLALFFKFNRFWSVRNFDLFLIILLAPGVLMIHGGRRWVDMDQYEKRMAIESPQLDSSKTSTTGSAALNNTDDSSQTPPPLQSDTNSGAEPTTSTEGEPTINPDGSAGSNESVQLNLKGYKLQRWGFYWLFSIGGLLLFRMLWDPRLVRRPLLDPNLSMGGLVFLGCSLMIFLFTNIIASKPTEADVSGAKSAIKLLKRETASPDDINQLLERGPGYAFFNLIPIVPTLADGTDIEGTEAVDNSDNFYRYVVAAKSLAITSQVLIVLGLVLIGYYHFNNFFSGLGMAAIYLMLPYTALFTGYVHHVLPAALIIWALLYFNRPLVSGILIGLAIGVSYFPLFLLPLWISFYWEKGARPFVLGIVIAFVFCTAGLIFTSPDVGAFVLQLRKMFGFMIPRMEGLGGIWALGWDFYYRLPLLVAFIAFCISFVFWPTHKNVGTLISYSCAVMIAVQYWHGLSGGPYLAWYLPLALLVIFRPNMDGRVAKSELIKAQENRRIVRSDATTEMLG